jgi:hypothetical protein
MRVGGVGSPKIQVDAHRSKNKWIQWAAITLKWKKIQTKRWNPREAQTWNRMQATLRTRENAHRHAGTRIASTDVLPAGWPFQRGTPQQPRLAATAGDPHERKEADDKAPTPQP